MSFPGWLSRLPPNFSKRLPSPGLHTILEPPRPQQHLPHLRLPRGGLRHLCGAVERQQRQGKETRTARSHGDAPGELVGCTEFWTIFWWRWFVSEKNMVKNYEMYPEFLFFDVRLREGTRNRSSLRWSIETDRNCDMQRMTYQSLLDCFLLTLHVLVWFSSMQGI